MFFLSFLSCCKQNVEEIYLRIEEGENFGSNIDGYQKKLPHNFCLDVDLDTKTRLFKVPDNLIDKPYFSNSVYNTPSIVEGRYIKGYYDNEKLILCEEISIGEFEYVVFNFFTQQITRITNEKELLKFEIDRWFILCNTIQEGIHY